MTPTGSPPDLPLYTAAEVAALLCDGCRVGLRLVSGDAHHAFNEKLIECYSYRWRHIAAHNNTVGYGIEIVEAPGKESDQ